MIDVSIKANELMSEAQTAAHSLFPDAASAAFLKSVRDFVAALSRVPDCPADTFSSVEIAQLSSAAERVILTIEARIESAQDRSGVRQQLAESIDDVRRELDEVSRWRRHFLQS
jgi:hypothetical protein